MKIRPYISKNSLIVLLCVLGILFAYWQDITIFVDDALRNDMASYILALPFLVAYMIYQKRSVVKAYMFLENRETGNRYFKDFVGASLCISALFLYLYGSFNFSVLEFHLISLMIFIFGSSIFLFGIQNLKNLALPLGFLLLLIVPYREEAYQAGGTLSVVTSTISFNILKFLRYPVTLSSIYESPSIIMETLSGKEVPFVVDIRCSGVYSLIGFFVFAVFFAYISRGSSVKKAIWLLLGFLLIYAVNIARVSLVLIVGYWFSAEIAMGLFHLLSGSAMIFLATLLMIFISRKSLKIDLFWKQQVTEEPCPSCGDNETRKETFCDFCGRFFNFSSITIPKVDLGKILAVSFLVAILMNFEVPAFALAQQNFMELDIQELTGSKETRSFLPSIEGYRPEFVYRDERFEKISEQDASLIYAYYPQNASRAQLYVTVEISDSYSKLHRWEACLVTSVEPGREIVNTLVSKNIQISENPPLVGRLFVYKDIRTYQTVMIAYWYEKAAFKTGGVWGNRYMKTSIIAYLDIFAGTGEIPSVNDYVELEDKLVLMAQDIMNYWEPVQAWSTFTIAFAKWGETLAIATIITTLSAVAILYFGRQKDEERRAYSIYKQLVWHSSFSENEREILKVLKILAEKKKSTESELAELYRDRTGKKIDQNKLTEIMKYSEGYGLIKKEITIKNEKPVVSWKPSTIFNI